METVIDVLVDGNIPIELALSTGDPGYFFDGMQTLPIMLKYLRLKGSILFDEIDFAETQCNLEKTLPHIYLVAKRSWLASQLRPIQTMQIHPKFAW